MNCRINLLGMATTQRWVSFLRAAFGTLSIFHDFFIKISKKLRYECVCEIREPSKAKFPPITSPGPNVTHMFLTVSHFTAMSESSFAGHDYWNTTWLCAIGLCIPNVTSLVDTVSQCDQNTNNNPSFQFLNNFVAVLPRRSIIFEASLPRIFCV